MILFLTALKSQKGRVAKGERGDPRGDGRTKSLKLPATLTHLISGAGQPDAVWEEKLLAADIGSTREPFAKGLGYNITGYNPRRLRFEVYHLF